MPATQIAAAAPMKTATNSHDGALATSTHPFVETASTDAQTPTTPTRHTHRSESLTERAPSQYVLDVNDCGYATTRAPVPTAAVRDEGRHHGRSFGPDCRPVGGTHSLRAGRRVAA